MEDESDSAIARKLEEERSVGSVQKRALTRAKAARVEGVVDGGQLCVSEAVSSALPHVHPDYTIAPMSKVELRGVKEEMQIYSITPKGLEYRVFDTHVGPEARIISTTNDACGGSGGSSSGYATTESCSSPPNVQNQSIQNTIRETFRALRGDDRIDVLERIRKAWRVQLPSNGPFKGIPEISGTRIISGRKTTEHEYQRLNNCNSPLSATGSMPVLNAVPVRVPCEEAFDENDEDIIFRVLAQRLAPRLTGPFPPSHSSNNRTGGSLVEMREMVAATMLDIPVLSNSVSTRRSFGNPDVTTSSSIIRRAVGVGVGGETSSNTMASSSILQRRPVGGGAADSSFGYSVLNHAGHQPSSALDMMDGSTFVPVPTSAWSMYSTN